MAEEKLLTVRDVAIVLGVSEKEVLDLAESGTIPAYKVGGVFLRFKKEQVADFKKTIRTHLSKAKSAELDYHLDDKVSDFFYFNDFYILAGLVVLILLAVIFKG